VSVCGPLPRFTAYRSCAGCSSRARRYPAWAQPVAVGTARRLRCDARPGFASQNSLRALRALRSGNRDESVHEARCARRPRACASRRHTQHPHRAPPAAWHRCLRSRKTAHGCLQRCVRVGCGVHVRCREAQGLRPRAQRELSTDSSRLPERSARRARSEFCDGAARPSIAGESVRSADRRSWAQQPARARLCPPRRSHAKRTLNDRNGPRSEHPLPCGRSRFPMDGFRTVALRAAPAPPPRRRARLRRGRSRRRTWRPRRASATAPCRHGAPPRSSAARPCAPSPPRTKAA